MESANLIDVQSISVGFENKAGIDIAVLRDIDLQVKPGETVGLVGESGSGKSTLAFAAMGFMKRGLKRMSGEAFFRGKAMFSASRKELEHVRGGKLALVPQNAGTALTPTLTIEAQLKEALRLHADIPEAEQDAKVFDLLASVRLPDPKAIAVRYPHELSGGQQQRVAIAMALAGDPDGILLDEPTTGLDVTTQAHILEMLRAIAIEHNVAMVYVSHDLGAIAQVCDRVVVMYAGEVVLDGPNREVLTNPKHPYARALLAAIPRLSDPKLPVSLAGSPPVPGSVNGQCSFADRCPLATESCRAARPALEDIGDNQTVRCLRANEVEDLATEGQGYAAHVADAQSPKVLALDKIAISYASTSKLERLFKPNKQVVNTVEGIDLHIQEGETIGLVGESGSGKSTILKTLAGLKPAADGSITLREGQPLPPRVENRPNELLKRIQLIFQNPDEAFNPRHTIAEILGQPLSLYHGLKGEERRARATELLEKVRLGARYLDRLPSQLSGGEKQRVAVARAFAANPKIVLCDEITSALDVSVQAAVLDLLNELKGSDRTTYIFVSHDLAVVRALSDRVVVLYQGRMVEHGPAADVYGETSHPYTSMLLGAALEPDPDMKPDLSAGDVTELSPPAKGCPFQRRCIRKVGKICDDKMPDWSVTPSGHAIRCHLDRAQLAQNEAQRIAAE